MARVSRKKSQRSEEPMPKSNAFPTAAYVRLSTLDNRNGNGDSIENQTELVTGYIDEKPYLQLISVYTDNGETGTNFERPSFEQLMTDVRMGKIKCIVVKDLSRFGRNYIETGNYIEKVFPFLGVRFIAIGDSFDSFDPKCQGEGLVIALKNLINDIYARDISKKVKTAFEVKKQKGDFIGDFAPYGYKKSVNNKNRLVIDDEAAEIVRSIFELKLDGMTTPEIARHLNAKNVLSPLNYRCEKGYDKRTTPKKHYWDSQTIKRILSNIVYLGHMVNGKTVSVPEQGYTIRKQNPSDWIITYNTHEAIVSEEKFYSLDDKSQVNYGDRKLGKFEGLPWQEQIFKGKLFCADCGRRLHSYKHYIKSRDCVEFSFACRVCKANATNKEKRQYIKQNDLSDIVYQTILQQINTCADIQKIAENIRNSVPVRHRVRIIPTEITTISHKLSRIDSLCLSLYKDFSEELLSESEYQYAKSLYENEKLSLYQRLNELKIENQQYTEDHVSENSWVSALEHFKSEKKLTTEMITALVERIEITGDKQVTISFYFQDEYQKLLAFIDEAKEAIV